LVPDEDERLLRKTLTPTLSHGERGPESFPAFSAFSPFGRGNVGREPDEVREASIAHEVHV